MAAYASLVSLNFMMEQIQQSSLRNKPHMECLKGNIAFLQAFLENYSQSSSNEFQELERQIANVCCEAEDVLESHVLDQILVKSRSKAKQMSKHFAKEVNNILEVLDSVKENASDMIKDGKVTDNQQSATTSSGPYRAAPSVDNTMVGFDDHLIQIMDKLTNDESDLRILPVVGMGGIGKTTLIRNVYDNQLIKEHFYIRLWSTISQSYKIQDVLVSFLRDLDVVYQKDIDPESYCELGEKLYKTLSGNRYLVVLDDMWGSDLWNSIRMYFPNNGYGSRIIVTTRLMSVATDIGSSDPYKLEFLGEDESWNLLKKKVFAQDGCPPTLEDVGRQIALSCKGLPMAIVVIGGLLAKSYKTEESWKYIAEALNSIVNSENDDYCFKVLSLSYDNLPIHLKPCFLYMGAFPEDSEVRVSKLLKLWVAEGFLKPLGSKCLEDGAMDYLTDLVERNLILVGKCGFSGKIKTCRIHDLLRDLCVRKAHEQNFMCFKRLHSLHIPPGKEWESKPHTNIYRVMGDKENQSFLYPSRTSTLRFSCMKFLSKLGVVDSNSLEKNQLLISSRCVTLLTDSIPAPKLFLPSVSVLWNLQTLIMCEMPENGRLILPYQFWEMPLLRNLEIAKLVLPYPPEGISRFYRKECYVLENMHTLLDVHDFKFTERVLTGIPNVKKLKVTYTNGSKGVNLPFNQLHKLESLSCLVNEKISLACISFPGSLKMLSLDGSKLPWEEMRKVGSLPSLEVLRLQNDAFYGSVWEPVEGEFCRLKSLHLVKMSLEHWEAESNHFPRLESLVLKDLWEMKEVPPSIGDIATLQLISLEFCSISLVNSAEQLKEQQEDYGNSSIQVQDNLTCGARDRLEEKLKEDLRLFEAFLENTSVKRRTDKKLNEVATQMRNLMHKAEDIIDTFAVMQAAKIKPTEYHNKLYEIAREVEAIWSKVKLDFAHLNKDRSCAKNEVPIMRQENIVGFEDEAKILIGYLKEEKEQLDVISIIGIPGSGKTTLARMIFRDPEIQIEFPVRVWVYVPQEFTRKNVFFAILKELDPLFYDYDYDYDYDYMRKVTDQQLAEKVVCYLKNVPFLIIMDNVGTSDDWEKLKVAFPTDNKMGKILITSPHAEVGIFSRPHSLRSLTEDGSLLLLCHKVFGKPEFPLELEHYGRLVVNKCDRLPLAIEVIGGILVNKSKNVADSWKKLYEYMCAHIVDDDSTKSTEKIIAYGYDNLPYHLRACILYLGMLPKGTIIAASRLTRMWIAEGFVQQIEDFSLEETAENYLISLINRNFLKAYTRRQHDGKVKTCYIDGMLHDFCRVEAGNDRENFFQEMRKVGEGTFHPPVADVQKYRRLCIHSNVTTFFTLKPYAPLARSFVCFSEEAFYVSADNISAMPKAFKLLRVLEAKSIILTKIPADMFELIHLRYIVIFVKSNIIPIEFSKLWNLQTLLVETRSETLEIRADIWKMKELRHFKTNSSAILSNGEKGGIVNENLQTLKNISPQSVTNIFLANACNLKKLGIRGRGLAMLFDENNRTVDSLRKLENVEELKLDCSYGHLLKFFSPYQFPAKLKSLTLVWTFLDWRFMSVLGLLENLEVLKLKYKAFTGKTWEVAEGGFRKLKYLYIDNLYLVKWMATEHHFPRLISLELSCCTYLREVPIRLAEIPSFNFLKLHHCKLAIESARKICARKIELQEDQTFELTILNAYR